MSEFKGRPAVTAIATFIALHAPCRLFAISADSDGVADGRTSSENLHDLAQLIRDLPTLSGEAIRWPLVEKSPRAGSYAGPKERAEKNAERRSLPFTEPHGLVFVCQERRGRRDLFRS